MRHYIELGWYQVYADLRAEAARSYLGVIWWVLEPLLYMMVFYIVFGYLLQRGDKGFMFFLLCGLVVWRWLDNTVRRGMDAISSNAALMLQVYLPKLVFPCVVLITSTVKFLLVLSLLVLFILIFGPPVTQAWLALPVLLIIQLIFVAACSWLVAAVVPFVPDLKVLIGNGLTLLFFLSGIFYDVRAFPEQTQFYFYLNPMVTLIDGYRTVLLEGLWPDWRGLGLVSLGSVLVTGIAARLLIRFDRIYPKLLIL